MNRRILASAVVTLMVLGLAGTATAGPRDVRPLKPNSAGCVTIKGNVTCQSASSIAGYVVTDKINVTDLADLIDLDLPDALVDEGSTLRASVFAPTNQTTTTTTMRRATQRANIPARKVGPPAVTMVMDNLRSVPNVLNQGAPLPSGYLSFLGADVDVPAGASLGYITLVGDAASCVELAALTDYRCSRDFRTVGSFVTTAPNHSLSFYQGDFAF